MEESFDEVADTNESSEVLIVDDDQLNLEAMRMMLQQFKLSASCARSGPDALKLVKRRLSRADLKLYSLILLDYSMPVMNGFQCVQEIRELVQKHLNHTLKADDCQPLIYCVTAYRQEGFAQKASEAGFDCTLVKPIFKGKLQEALQKSRINLQ